MVQNSDSKTVFQQLLLFTTKLLKRHLKANWDTNWDIISRYLKELVSFKEWHVPHCALVWQRGWNWTKASGVITSENQVQETDPSTTSFFQQQIEPFISKSLFYRLVIYHAHTTCLVTFHTCFFGNQVLGHFRCVFSFLQPFDDFGVCWYIGTSGKNGVYVPSVQNFWIVSLDLSKETGLRLS